MKYRAPGTAPRKAATAHSFLRDATRVDHDAVDSVFAAFRLDDRESYGRFLSAHARILPRAEAVTDPAALLPGWVSRTPALLGDLDALGLGQPTPVDALMPGGPAERWGALYVIEGSRLGSALLSRRVPEGLPVAYLSSVHGAGAWRGFLSRMDAADEGSAWRQRALVAAKKMFSAYAQAVKEELSHG